ncbi:MAG: VWA domain-containing protein, partial [Bryobacteraceae bacterium]
MRFAAFFLWMAAASAQQVGQNTPPGNGTTTFTSSAQLVIETVAVTGKDGRPVTNLTADGFTVTENGVPQTIRFFEYQNLPQVSASAATQSPAGHITIFDKLGRTQIAPAKPGSNEYKDRRLLALYFDMTAMPPPDQMRALTAAKSFLRTQMLAADLIAILRYSGGSVDVLQDFTADRGRLLSIIETLIVGEGQGLDDTTSDASSADTGAAFGQDDSEFNI